MLSNLSRNKNDIYELSGVTCSLQSLLKKLHSWDLSDMSTDIQEPDDNQPNLQIRRRTEEQRTINIVLGITLQDMMNSPYCTF